MTRPNTDHVVVDMKTGNWCCRNCGEERPAPVMPLPGTDFIRKMNGFIMLHESCPKPLEPSKQVELFDALRAKEANRTGVTACHGCGWGDGHAEGCTVAAAEALGYYDADPGIDGSTDDPAPEIDPPAQCAPCYFCRSATAPRSPCPLCHKSVCQNCGDMEGESCCDAESDADGNPIPPPAYPQFADPDYEPPVDPYSKFVEMYPWPSDVPTLRRALSRALTIAQGQALQSQPLPPPDTAAFQMMAAWVRIEEAHLDSEARGISNPIGGLTIPARLPMPEALKKLLTPPKRKRGARPLANPKGRKTA